MKKIAAFLVLALIASAFLLPSPACAGDTLWYGTIDNTWATGGNWSAGVPGASDTAVFDDPTATGYTINLGGGVTVGAVEIRQGGGEAYTIGSGAVGSQSLTLSNGGSITATAAEVYGTVFNSNVILGTNATAQTYTITDNAINTEYGLTFAGNISGGSTGLAGIKTLVITGSAGGGPVTNTTISGNISNGGATAVALTKGGDSVLLLSGTNSYTGTTTINGGTLEISGGAAIADTGAVVLADAAGVILQLDSSERIGSLSGGGGTGGEVALQANTLTVGNASDTTYDGVISGTGGILIKEGSGSLTLTGTNTYTGATNINAGTIIANGANVFGTATGGVVVATGATLNLGNTTIVDEALTLNGSGASSNGALLTTTGAAHWAGSVALASDSVINTDGADCLLSGTVSGAGGIEKIGNDTLFLTGNNSYSGTTTITNGTLEISGGSAIANNGMVTLANTAGVILRLNANETIGELSGGGSNGGDIDLTGATLTTSFDASEITYRGVISGGGGFTKDGTAGTGIINLTGVNTYTGTTTINNGYITLGSNQTLHDSSAVVINTAGILNINGYSETIGDLSGDGILRNSGPAGATLTIQETGDTSFSGTLQDDASTLALTKAGSGTLVLSGTNTYTGTTTINDGVLRISGSAAIADTGAVVLADAAGVTLELDSSERIGSLSGGGGTGGEVALQANTLTVGDASDTTFAGVISGTGGSLVKVGSGTLTLSGSNTYTGLVTVSEGILGVAHPNALGTSAGGVAVANGATISLDSSVDIGEALTVNGTGVASGGALRNTFDGNTWSGNITLASSSSIISAVGTLNITGSIAGSASGFDITMGGAGNLLMQGTINSNVRNLTKVGAGELVLSDVSYSGSTTISDGTLKLINPVTTLSAFTVTGTFDIYGNNQTVGSLAGGGTVTSTQGGQSAILTCGGDDTSTTFSGLIEDGTDTVGLTKTGSGTLALTGANNYSGGTTVTEGVLNIQNDTALGTGNVTVASGAAIELGLSDPGWLTVSNTLTLNGTGIANGGALRNKSTGSNSWVGDIILGSDARINSDADTLYFFTAGGAYDLTIGGAGDTDCVNGISIDGDLIKDGAGTLRLRSGSSYSGGTIINDGTFELSNADAIPDTSAVTIASGATLDLYGFVDTIGSLAGAGTITNSDIVLIALLACGGDGTTTTFSGLISGMIALTKEGAGTLTLSGANTYTDGTTISGGTIAVGSPTALGAGAVTNNATLDLGTTNLNIASTYDQVGKLKLTVTSASNYGTLTSTGAATVTGSTIDVTVNGYLADNTTLDIVTSSGLTYNTTTINPLGNPHYSFTASNSGTVLTLTVDRAANVFSSAATNANTRAVGTVLDNITNPTADMTTVLDALDAMSDTQINTALNTMLPDYSGASIQVSQHTLDQLTDAILGHQSYLRNNPSGVSTGSDMLKGVDIWAQGYGSYLHQDPRELSQGYNASIWGTALGFDIPAMHDIRIGTCFGFAQDYIRGKDNSNRNDINSYQWTVYGEYACDRLYIDLSGAFALNTYDANRKVNVGPAIQRTASADYNGQQYQVYTEAGYTIGYKKLNVTPLASFQYQHLHLDKYTEEGAGALNLTVKAQDYDLAQTGLGIKLDYPLDTKYGTLVPEVRVKWLYDWIGDAQATTSTFTGGGGSFATGGFDPAQSSWDFGTKVMLFTKNNWTIAANYDFELKEDYYGHYGYANAKYSF